METIVPFSLKGYELHERIGAGGFGAVYRAFQSTVSREVAVKIILPGLANQPEFIRRFEAEAQIVARLEHPHIVPLHDYWRDPEGAYLIMRWLRGGNLHDALQKGAFDVRAAALLLDQMAGALSLAHRNQVIHRDIKPANILLDEDGNAYLTDFGIAKDLNIAANNTQPDAIVGSLDYISPEQARSEAVTQRTDIYSLGVTFYEVLTGEHPFQNLSSVERLYKHINDPLPDITVLDSAIRGQVNRVIQKATAKNPEHRYADVLAFAADFRQAIAVKSAPLNIVELLTQREQEILQLIVEGNSNKEIAQRLTVTLSTVKWYVNQIYAKLGVRSRVQAMVRARELNLLTKSEDNVSVTPIPTEDFQPENPYKGLRAFQSADNQDFFGREKVTAKLVKQLEEGHEFKRFLAVIGPSGSGKSSIVKAGLIPALWRGDLPGSEKWFIIDMLPGAHPLDELEIALTRIAANQSGGLKEQLSRDKRGLIRAAQLILPDDGSDLVLVIDQFEEVFTLLEDEAARIHFLDLLYTAVTEPRSRVSVVITLRADFYDRPLHYADFGELIRSRMETILPLSSQELERAISKPAERAGVSFEPGLVASIVAEVNYQAGALPLLQYALTELFDQRRGRLLTRETYDAIGGTVGALARRADEIYTDFGAASQEAARQMFLRLVTLGEGVEDTRRRVARSELLAIAPDSEVMDEVIDTYSEYRLLSLDNDPGTRIPTVELAHEAILRAWERLHNLLNENRDDIKSQRQLGAMAAEWRTSKQDNSFLVRGARLEQFEKWVAGTQLALTGAERAYLDASIAHQALEEKAESERKAREKILERRSVTFLRGLVVVLVLATLGAFALTGIAVSESQNARHSAAEAQNVALIAGSQAALANGNSDQAIALALQAVTLNPASTSAQVALGQAGYEPGTVRRFVGHTDEVWGVAFSADNHTAVSSSKDGTLIQWDVATGNIIRQFMGGHSAGNELRVDMSPDGHTILSGAVDGLVLLWDVATGNIISHFEGHTGGVKCVKFSPDGRTALSCGQDKTLILWDAQIGTVVRRFIGHTDVVESANFSPDGHTILSGSDDNTLILWDAQTGMLIRQFKSPNEVYSVTFSRDGQQAFIGLRDGSGYLLNLATGETVQHFIGHTRTLFSAVFTPDGKHVLTAGVDKWMGYWDVETGQLIKRFEGHSATVTQVALAADGRYALSASADMTERLWDLESGQLIRRFEGHKAFVFFVKISPDGRTGISTSDDGTAVLWDIETGQKLQRLIVPLGNGTTDAAYLLDGKKALIATGKPDYNIFVPGDIILWDLATGEEIRHFKGHQAQVACLSISPDGRTFLSGATDGSLFLWDIATGQIIRRFEGNPQWVDTVAFSPDGATMLSGGHSGNLIMWDVQTGKMVQSLVGHTGIVGDVKFLQDGNRALSGGQSDALLWNLSNGSLIGHFPGGKVISLDEHLIFGDFGAYPVLWDVATSTIIREYAIADRRAYFNAFTPDSRRVLLGFSDGGLELWRMDATLNDLLTWIRGNRYVPDLTCEQRDLYRLEPLCKAVTEKLPSSVG